MTNVEPAAATGGTGLFLAADVANANSWLQFAIGALTLAWWLRIWFKNANCPPPTK
jgi:hypothetical protein